MSEANIIHSRYGLRCEKLDKPLNLGWGLDNSAVLHCPGELPTGWLCDALDLSNGGTRARPVSFESFDSIEARSRGKAALG